MRWIWIDKFVEFHSGQSATAMKNVTLAEEHLHDHFPGFPVMPETLCIEGMAQTAGILVGEAKNFKEKVILAKIKKAVFSPPSLCELRTDKVEYNKCKIWEKSDE